MKCFHAAFYCAFRCIIYKEVLFSWIYRNEHSPEQKNISNILLHILLPYIYVFWLSVLSTSFLLTNVHQPPFSAYKT